MGLADSEVLARFATGAQVRCAIRQGRCFQQTSGLAPGFVQGNIVILPGELAGDFQRFCVHNPRPCPLLAMGVAGNPTLPTLGEDIDVRTDLPRYRVWRHGELVDEPIDIRALWRNDLVSFVLGCSFSFDEALLAQGIPLRHIERGTNVPMYRTSVQTTPAGPFRGPLVVSMRPLSPGDAIRAIQITTRFPSVHGAPVHIGEPELLGIGDLSRPDYGDPVEIRTREIPVFWACGVTPQAAIATARLPFCITHAPGAMLVTDQLNAHLATS